MFDEIDAFSIGNIFFGFFTGFEQKKDKKKTKLNLILCFTFFLENEYDASRGCECY